jgi:SLAP domain-containing protein
MKKLFVLMSICLCVVFMFAGCNQRSEITISQPTSISQLGYSFAPTQSADKVSDVEKKNLLNELKKADAPRKGISFYGYDAQYKDDGSLEVKGFVRNNTGDTVFDIKGTFDILYNNIKIASAEFDMNKSQFGELVNKDNRPWTLLFKPSQVTEKVDSLEGYIVKVNVDYKIIK